MVTIRHIDKEAYAAKALDLLNVKWEGYVNYALGLMQENMSPGMAGERLEKKVCSEMEDVLFNYLKRSGKVSGGYKHQYYHVPYGASRASKKRSTCGTSGPQEGPGELRGSNRQHHSRCGEALD